MRSLLLWAGLVQSLTYALVTLEKARQRHSGRSAGGPRELHLQLPEAEQYTTKDQRRRATVRCQKTGTGDKPSRDRDWDTDREKH